MSDLSFALFTFLECDNDHRNVSMGCFLVILVTDIDCINTYKTGDYKVYSLNIRLNRKWGWLRCVTRTVLFESGGS
ncbi:hypothetical protein L1D37_01920 [Vibrio sp. Isolate33]|uniref:hypothetical protein n=1 Tax=Vibrio sp. Isolate33 TaxID=2908539 RepID=UPI001EFD62A0|nr:hypothetical protein [Vibrio sp. Isolate33]MCG9542530.1 hypothetical protein [Vibrio sp. Isolate33]